MEIVAARSKSFGRTWPSRRANWALPRSSSHWPMANAYGLPRVVWIVLELRGRNLMASGGNIAGVKRGSERSFDSAEKPQRIKNEQLKTPPKDSKCFEKIAYGSFQSEVF